ncbi:MAG: hypothetical protein LGB01_06515 [Sulfurovum sp.]|nr:hypothetical protein [Sulfurovum sp.]
MASASSCSNKLFSVTIDSQLTIEDVIENLADTCALTVIIKDEATQQRMKKNFYYVKLKNSTLKGFLNTVFNYVPTCALAYHARFKEDSFSLNQCGVKAEREDSLSLFWKYSTICFDKTSLR